MAGSLENRGKLRELIDKLQIYYQLRWHPLSRLGEPIKVIKKMKQTDNFKFAEFDPNKTSS